MSAIQNVANVAGVSLMSWNPRDEVPETFYARVPMSIELKGRYHQIAKFFYSVGQLDRIINVEDISISSPSRITRAVLACNPINRRMASDV